MNQLLEKGYVLIPSNLDVGELRRSIQYDVDNFPEYTNTKNGMVLGGFAAYNNASSFHCPSVRNIRQKCYPIVAPVIKSIAPSGTWYFESIPDRLCIREPNTTVTAESWHRDESIFALETDDIFGGWINLDDFDSYFSCIPGTHIRGRDKGSGGFAKISKGQVDETKKVLVKIPPGYILVFFETLIHEVLRKKIDFRSYRLFLGWRLTESNKPLLPDLDSMLERQAPITIKSGQEPPMYPKLYWVNYFDRLESFSKNFVPQILEHKVRKTIVWYNKDTKEKIRPCEKKKLPKEKVYSVAFKSNVVVVPRVMKGLRDYNLPCYSPYSKEEYHIYYPQLINQ
jgi:hypothetical protein